jgi:hypothetical protein
VFILIARGFEKERTKQWTTTLYTDFNQLTRRGVISKQKRVVFLSYSISPTIYMFLLKKDRLIG